MGSAAQEGAMSRPQLPTEGGRSKGIHARPWVELLRKGLQKGQKMGKTRKSPWVQGMGAED